MKINEIIGVGCWQVIDDAVSLSVVCFWWIFGGFNGMWISVAVSIDESKH